MNQDRKRRELPVPHTLVALAGAVSVAPTVSEGLRLLAPCTLNVLHTSRVSSPTVREGLRLMSRPVL